MVSARLAVLGIPMALAAGAVPAHGSGVMALQGHGVQIYVCQGNPKAYAWKLVGPEATLTDAAGRPAGRHYAGPAWQASDGSTVIGAVVAAARPDGAIPWLVLRATSHAGNGMFAGVTFVTRSQTAGGLPPSGGCDAAHAGMRARSPYSATYSFFGTP